MFRKRTYYQILGIAMGAGIEHIRASYRLLTRKNVLTDAAYEILTDSEKRSRYDVWLLSGSGPKIQREGRQGDSEPEQDWGCRGRERCSCGRVLEEDDDWYCQECCGKIDHFVVFDMFGAYIVHEGQMPVVSHPDGEIYWQAPYGSMFGPFTKEEAEAFIREKNEARNK